MIKQDLIDHLYMHLRMAEEEFNGLVGRFLSEEEQLRVLSLGDEIDDITRQLCELGEEI